MIQKKSIKVLFLLIFIAPLMLKIIYIDHFMYVRTGVKFLGAYQAITNDAIIFFSIIALFYLSLLTKVPRLISIAFRAFALILFCIYIADIIILLNFNTHLTVTDFQKYASYSLKYIQQILGLRAFLLLLIILPLIGFIYFLIFRSYNITSTRQHLIAAFVLAILLLTSAFNSRVQYVHSWVYKNVIDYNLTVQTESSEYSESFTKRMRFKNKNICSPHTPEQKNIIILMVESLSSYQSNLFSGIKNWTPHLDGIAENNIHFKNFYANGFNTEDAEIALLTGLLPIYQPSSYSRGGGTSFSGFFNVTRSLPNTLNANGYKTEFLTTADLSFADTGKWAKSIGFDYVEGHEHPYYNDWARYHFKAAPDEALYDRTLDRIEKNKNNKYLIFIKTVSTHHPFVNPENGNRSEAEAFQYADRQIGIFHKNLIDNGFFDNGILIIVGDHHSMIPLKKNEISKFGPMRASSRIPLIISYGDKVKRIEYDQYQQTDIHNSLSNLVSNKQCYSDWTGDLLGKEKLPPKYIAYRRGDTRNIISVFYGNADYEVMLDGDSTSIINAKQLPKSDTDSTLR